MKDGMLELSTERLVSFLWGLGWFEDRSLHVEEDMRQSQCVKSKAEAL